MAALCTCVMAWSKVTGICLNSASIDAVNFVSVRARSSLSAVSSPRSEEHTSELQSLMRISYAVFCLKKKNNSRLSTQSIQDHNKHEARPYTLTTNYLHN